MFAGLRPRLLADEILRLVDILLRDQDPRRAVAKIQHHHQRQTGNGRGNPGRYRWKKVDVTVDDGLRLNACAHLDVLGFETVFLQKPFFLGDVVRHVRERQGRKTDSNLLQAFGGANAAAQEQNESYRDAEDEYEAFVCFARAVGIHQSSSINNQAVAIFCWPILAQL